MNLELSVHFRSGRPVRSPACELRSAVRAVSRSPIPQLHHLTLRERAAATALFAVQFPLHVELPPSAHANQDSANGHNNPNDRVNVHRALPRMPTSVPSGLPGSCSGRAALPVSVAVEPVGVYSWHQHGDGFLSGGQVAAVGSVAGQVGEARAVCGIAFGGSSSRFWRCFCREWLYRASLES